MPSTETVEQVREASRKRLHPSITHSSWLVLRRRRELFREWLALLPHQNLSVLDVGGRLQPYRELIQTKVERYVAVDLRLTPLVNVIANAEQLPMAGERFDLVFCTQMLEYAPDPGKVLREIHRALKPGGVLLLSVPSLAMRDADVDRWRFWPAGIRQLLADFSNVKIVPDGGSVTGFFRSMNVGLEVLAKYPAVRWVLRHSMIPISNLGGMVLEKLAGSANDTFTVNYSVRAQK